jgi:hypothetical protein
MVKARREEGTSTECDEKENNVQVTWVHLLHKVGASGRDGWMIH